MSLQGDDNASKQMRWEMVIRTFVARSDGMIRIVAPLGTSNDMPPPGTDLGARRDGDDVAVLVLNVVVASEAAVVDVLDRVVAGGGPDPLQSALVDAVDRELLKDGMAGNTDGEAEDYCRDLHGASSSRSRVSFS